jgi:molecular chaperone HscA
VKSTGGDSALGGDDFDRAIAGRVLDEMGAAREPGIVRRALDAARAARERLTCDAETELAIGKHKRKLGREELEALIRPSSSAPAGPAGARSRTPASAGRRRRRGAGRRRDAHPAGARYVEQIFGKRPLGDIDPDKVVASAPRCRPTSSPAPDATMCCSSTSSRCRSGIETMGGVVEKIIPRNSTIPAGASQEFTTYADKQTGFDIHVVQGERDSVEHCRSLARFVLKGIPPMAAGMAKVKITFMVDADGILQVMAHEETSGVEAKVDVKPSYGLTDEEVERMLLESYEHADEDMRSRLLATERVEATADPHRHAAAMREDATLLDEPDRARPWTRPSPCSRLAPPARTTAPSTTRCWRSTRQPARSPRPA